LSRHRFGTLKSGRKLKAKGKLKYKRCKKAKKLSAKIKFSPSAPHYQKMWASLRVNTTTALAAPTLGTIRRHYHSNTGARARSKHVKLHFRRELKYKVKTARFKDKQRKLSRRSRVPSRHRVLRLSRKLLIGLRYPH
jgi:hypothetical protein